VVSSTPQPHFTPAKDPVPIVQEAGWAPGSVWTGGKSRKIPDRPARSQSLYQLSYPVHSTIYNRRCVNMSICYFLSEYRRWILPQRIRIRRWVKWVTHYVQSCCSIFLVQSNSITMSSKEITPFFRYNPTSFWLKKR